MLSFRAEYSHCGQPSQSPTDSLHWRGEALIALATTHHGAQRAWGLTYALWVTACPGAIDRAVSAEQARGVVAFPALVDDGAGEAQAVTERDSGIAWSPGVPTRDH